MHCRGYYRAGSNFLANSYSYNYLKEWKDE